MNDEHRFAHFILNGNPVLTQAFNVLITNFIFLEMVNSVTNAPVGIDDGSGALIHHAARLERIVVEMIEKAVERIGGGVVIFHPLGSCHDVGFHIHVHVHIVGNRLLPRGLLGINRLGHGKHHAKKRKKEGGKQ